jgi:hypothetical protein
MAQQMQQVPIGTIHPYGNNPRDNTKSVDKVAESIRNFGFLQPIVCDDHGIILPEPSDGGLDDLDLLLGAQESGVDGVKSQSEGHPMVDYGDDVLGHVPVRVSGESAGVR